MKGLKDEQRGHTTHAVCEDDWKPGLLSMRAQEGEESTN